ncbi:hypothetical protein [Dokdonia sp.]|uniref:hypothetical protein n=1 Tax=Dokdonia sp. TaxID=2024995 RepID=UPI00326697E5
MGKYKYILLGLAVMLFWNMTVLGQTFEDDSEDQDVSGDTSSLTNETISSQILLNLGFDTSVNPRNQQITGNSIFLAQIGELNIASINSNTSSSEIQLTQRGNSNFTALDYRANTAIATITQQGDFNLIRDFVNNPTADVSLDLIQDGNNLTFERFGTNSITRSLRFVQTEASPTIIIRSFQ